MLTNHDIDSHSPFACLLLGQPPRAGAGELAGLTQAAYPSRRYTARPVRKALRAAPTRRQT